MTAANGFFGLTLEKALENSAAFDLDNDAIKGQLHISTFTPNFNTNAFQSDLANEVANGNGYTTGGIALTIVTAAPASLKYTFDCNDNSWPSSTFTARAEIGVDTTPGSAGTNWLVYESDFGSDFTTNNGTFLIQRHVNGIFTVTYG
jgi:hypothetical protein